MNRLDMLPQTIKNLICEFNVDHREQMEYVLQELIEKEYTCWFCDIIIENNRKVRYIMFKKFIFCGCPDSRCSSDGEELIRESRMY